MVLVFSSVFPHEDHFKKSAEIDEKMLDRIQKIVLE